MPFKSFHNIWYHGDEIMLGWSKVNWVRRLIRNLILHFHFKCLHRCCQMRYMKRWTHWGDTRINYWGRASKYGDNSIIQKEFSIFSTFKTLSKFIIALPFSMFLLRILTCIASQCKPFDTRHTSYFFLHIGYQNQFLSHLIRNHLFFLERWPLKVFVETLHGLICLCYFREKHFL